MDRRGHTSAERNGLSNSLSQWTTLDTIYISKCKEGGSTIHGNETIRAGSDIIKARDRII